MRNRKGEIRMKTDTKIRKITEEEFYKLKTGDVVYIDKVGYITLQSKVLSKPIFNSAADKPGWEVETTDGWSDMNRLYVPCKDYNKTAPNEVVMKNRTKEEIYDELSSVLTEYETGTCNEKDLYAMLCKIQTNWESVITAQEEIERDFA